MPLIFKKTGLLGETFGSWKIEEPEVFFQKRLDLAAAELAELSEIHTTQRRLEWLAGRLLLHKILGEKRRLEISKTAAGKPFWPADGARFFSISHSAGKIAAAIVSDRPCGIDVQIFTEKIRRIGPRFLSENELAAGDLTDDFLHQNWGAKEAMFKAWGRGGVDFRRHLSVGKIEGGHAAGQFRRADAAMGFGLFFEKIEVGNEPFMLARAVETGHAAEPSATGFTKL